MLEATSQASSTDQGSQSNTAAATDGASQIAAQTTASQTATADAAAAQAAQTAATTQPKTRPEGVPDSFWDKDKGELKTADWAKSYEELRQAKAEIDARKAQIPAQADLYKPELPKDMKVPEGMAINTDDPLWKDITAIGHKMGWTQSDLSEVVGAYAKIEGAKHEALQAAVKQRDEALGANGAQRVDALSKWFVATSDDAVGKQLSQTLFTPDIIKWFEGMKQRFSSQGVQKFSAIGREASEGRTDGRPDNWNDMSPTDRLYWKTVNEKNVARKVA